VSGLAILTESTTLWSVQAHKREEKMKKIKRLGLVLAVAGLSVPAIAQEEDGPLAYTYATYFQCTGDMSIVDEMMEEDAERMNEFVEDGTIGAWGWLAHHTGGRWQRLAYYQAETMEELLDAYDVVNDDDDRDDSDDDGPSFASVCWGHEDYIWQLNIASSTDERGDVGFSVYYDCDIAREDEAGEIVEEHFAPILNGFVEDGKLASWGWSTHVVGGHVRALQTMTAKDVKSLLAARAAAIEAIYAEDSLAGAEFAEICGKHEDYIWEIQLEN
jgi:aryl-alcohol dehydrogenase-like predicted oxidoreductase